MTARPAPTTAVSIVLPASESRFDGQQSSPPQQSRATAASDGSWKMNHDGRYT